MKVFRMLLPNDRFLFSQKNLSLCCVCLVNPGQENRKKDLTFRHPTPKSTGLYTNIYYNCLCTFLHVMMVYTIHKV